MTSWSPEVSFHSYTETTAGVHGDTVVVLQSLRGKDLAKESVHLDTTQVSNTDFHAVALTGKTVGSDVLEQWFSTF